MTSEFLLGRGRMETSRASVGTEERKHSMPYPAKLIEGGEGVALDSAKPSLCGDALCSVALLTVSLSIRI